MSLEVIDEVIAVQSDDAMEWARQAAIQEALFVGISSGAVLKACNDLACQAENFDKTIVTILPSYGERYLSSDLFANLG